MSNSHRPAAGAPLLRVDRVSRIYPEGAVTALLDVSLEFQKGEYVAIMGPSGSGKSTLLNLLGALDKPTAGEIYFDGQPLSGNRNLDVIRAEKIGFVFQSFHLLPSLTTLQNIQVPMLAAGRKPCSRVERARELLELVALGHRAGHLPSQLSVGQRQRVAIARALANDPPLLLADEPTGNLDSRAGAEALALFDRLHRQHGKTLIVITHSAEVAARAERVIWIRDGRIVTREAAAA